MEVPRGRRRNDKIKSVKHGIFFACEENVCEPFLRLVDFLFLCFYVFKIYLFPNLGSIGIKFERVYLIKTNIMCFSAGASFGAAAVLGGIGVLTLRKVSTRSQIMYASIPLLFAIQQVSEGLLWLSLSYSEYGPWQTPATYFFLFFAQFLWPIWIPGAILLMERNKNRKKILWIPVIAGVIGSSILAYRMIFNAVYAQIEDHHISYVIGSTQLQMIISSVMYVIAILAPSFISSARGIKAIAFLLVISLLATKIMYEAYLISVWCFFAATISILIYRVLKLEQEEVYTAKSLQHRTD